MPRNEGTRPREPLYTCDAIGAIFPRSLLVSGDWDLGSGCGVLPARVACANRVVNLHQRVQCKIVTTSWSLGLEAKEVEDDMYNLLEALVVCPSCENPYEVYSESVERFMLWGTMGFRGVTCSSCGEQFVVRIDDDNSVAVYYYEKLDSYEPSPTRLPPQVPEQYANEYYKCFKVLLESPNGSATLSRRLLQLFLRQEKRVKDGRLEDEIDEFRRREQLSPKISNALHMIRHVGNRGAHPANNSGRHRSSDVTPGEAELLLHILRQLFYLHFVKNN